VRRVSQVTRAVAQEFASWLSGRVSANTFNKHVQLFRLVFRVLCDDLGIEANPWRAIQKRKNGAAAHGRRAFRDEELRRIFHTLSRRVKGRQVVWGEDGAVGERKLAFDEVAAAGEMLTLCLLGFHTGLRLGDCCLLRWEDVALDKGVISVTPMKTARTSGRTVAIPIHPELAARLSLIRPERPEGPVCPLKAGQYARDRTEVAKRFALLFRQCGIRTSAAKAPNGAHATCEVGFHSFRHTWVTRAAEDGVDPITIREVVGWGSPAMERIYTHVSPEHVRAQMGKRTSKAFPSPGAPAAPAARPAADLAAMDTDGIRELAKALAEELAKRGAKSAD
jgi:integrase